MASHWPGIMSWRVHQPTYWSGQPFLQPCHSCKQAVKNYCRHQYQYIYTQVHMLFRSNHECAFQVTDCLVCLATLQMGCCPCSNTWMSKIFSSTQFLQTLLWVACITCKYREIQIPPLDQTNRTCIPKLLNRKGAGEGRRPPRIRQFVVTKIRNWQKVFSSWKLGEGEEICRLAGHNEPHQIDGYVEASAEETSSDSLCCCHTQ